MPSESQAPVQTLAVHVPIAEGVDPSTVAQLMPLLSRLLAAALARDYFGALKILAQIAGLVAQAFDAPPKVEPPKSGG